MKTFTPAEIKNLPSEEIELVSVVLPSDLISGHVETYVYNKELNDKTEFPGGGRCCLCGSTRLIYSSNFVHLPTGRGFITGCDCAAKLENLPAGTTFKIERAMNALREKAVSRKRKEAFFEEHPEHREILEWADESRHHIAGDIAGRFARNGYVSEKQIELLYRIQDQEADRLSREAAEAEEAKNALPFPEGRVTVRGEVLGTKRHESQFGITYKMLVKGEDGNKYWGTIPAAIGAADKGAKVEFVATVERSKDDEHFGFFSRPSKAKFTENYGAEEEAA